MFLPFQLQCRENEIVYDLLLLRLKIGQETGNPVGNVIFNFLFGTGNIGKKLLNRDSESNCNFHNAFYGRVFLSPFQLPDIGRVQITLLSESLLAQLLLLAKAPDPAADNFADIFHILIDSLCFGNGPFPSLFLNQQYIYKEKFTINIHYKYGLFISIYYRLYLRIYNDYKYYGNK